MKKRMIKLLALCLSAVTVGASLGGCAQQSVEEEKPVQTETSSDEKEEAGKEEEKKEESKKPVTITAMITQSRNYEGLQKMIQKLEEEENIIIDAQIVPDDQYLNLAKMKVNSGEAPDMLDYNIPSVFYDLDPEKFFVDLSDESWVADLVSPDTVDYNGKIYGYPFQSVQGVLGFVYNKDVFESLNLEVPTNWDELMAVCETIKTEGNGITPIHMPKDTWVPQIYMTANFSTALGVEKSVEVADKIMKNELKWTEVPELEQVLDQYLSLFQKGYINDDFTSVNYDNTIEAMGTGEAAMVFCGDFFANSVMEAFPEANLGMFDVRMVGDEDLMAATTASVGFVASKDSENIDTVKRIFELWSTPEYGDLYFENRPGFPALATIDGGETPEYLKAVDEQYIKQGKTVEEFNTSVAMSSNVINSHLWLYYIDAPAKGDMTGADMLEKFQGDYEKYMKEMQYPGF